MKETFNITYIDLSQKRDIQFPFLLDKVGVINTEEQVTYNLNYNTLEFCLRLQSDEDVAIDELDGDIFTNRFPHLFIKRPGANHRYTMRSSRYACFFIYPAELMTEFEKIGMGMNPPGIEFEITSEMENLLTIFHELIPRSHTRGAAEKFDLLAFQMLENIYMQKFTPQTDKDTVDCKIREIASYFQLHYNSKIDLDEICRKFGISRRCFFRNWAKHYDHSPSQYITDLKIREAIQLLSIPNLHVREIAEQLGFDNHSYFIQVFRRHNNGMTPGEYRKSMAK